MLGAAQKRHEGRGLVEERDEALQVVSPPLRREYLAGRLGTHYENAANSVGRLWVVDGAIAVGPINVLAVLHISG